MTNRLSEIALLKDSEWSTIDSELCKVLTFTPLTASISNGKVLTLNKTLPYASVILECKKTAGSVTGFITHRRDFVHLWSAFKERGISDNEEVIITWSTKNYRWKLFELLPAFLPKLWVMVFLKGAFELMTDSTYKPELVGEARARATLPIASWKPEYMK